MQQQVWNTVDVEYGTLNWLRREIALKMGHHPDHNLLGRTERAHVDSIIESGLRQFAQAAWPAAPSIPEPPDGEGRDDGEYRIEQQKEAKRRPPHSWSFLKRIHDIATVASKNNYILPDDFGGRFDEPTTVRTGGRIAIVREAHLRQLISSDPQSGKPAYCALRRTSIGGSSKQQTEILFYPTPDAIETIQVEYNANPVALDENNPYPPGGVEHAETVLAYCYYVLAQRAGEGIQEAALQVQDRLIASIVLDRGSAKPTADGVWVDDDGRFNAAYLSRMIGRHIGAGPNPKVWTHQQEQLIAEALRRARRRVYNPPVLQDLGEKYPHDWTFLRPIGTLQFAAGVSEYDLPADFVQMYGPMTYATDGTVLYSPIQFVGESKLRQMLQRQDASTRPTLAAIRPKHDDSVGTIFELLVWPVPDDDYVVNYRYRVNPDTGGVNSLPALVDRLDLHGGDRFSEMYLEAAMLSADELMGKNRSVHEERFYRAVKAAVGQDRMTHAPDSLGYNGDPTSESGRHGDYDWHDFDENIVTYNGVAY